MTADPGGSLSLYSVGRSAVILTGGAVAVQVVGIVRELFLATQVGATAQLDAFLIALVLPIALPSILTSGAVTALVPAYLEAQHISGSLAARRLAGTVVVWVGLIGTGIWLGLVLLAEPVVSITGPGLTATGHAEAVAFLRLIAPIAFITSVSAILFAICQAEQRFVVIAFAGLAGQATTLAILLVYWDSIGLQALAIGSLVGPVIVTVVILAAMARGSILPVPVVRSGGHLAPFVHHATPLTIGAAILQLNIIADRAVASLLGPGSVSILRYADVLVRIPVGAIGPAWGSAIYPALVRSTLGGVVGSLALDTQRTLRYASAVFVPVAMLTAAVAPVAVGLAYGRGAFTDPDLDLTARAVAAFAPLLMILMISPILTGALNARRRGRILLAGAMVNVMLNVALDVLLGITLGVAGVALASSIASSVVLAFFTWRMTVSEVDFVVRPFARTLGFAIAASAPVSLVTALLCWSGVAPVGDLQRLILLVVVAVLGPLAYLATANAIGMAEPRNLAGMTVSLARRRFERGRA